MTLRLRYSIRRQALCGLYDLIDADTDEYLTPEPLPWDEALKAKQNAENLLTATTRLANAFGWVVET